MPIYNCALSFFLLNLLSLSSNFHSSLTYKLIRKSATTAITMPSRHQHRQELICLPFPLNSHLPWIASAPDSSEERPRLFLQQHTSKKIFLRVNTIVKKKNMIKTLLATTLVGSAIAADVVLEDFSNPYVVVVHLSRFQRDRNVPLNEPTLSSRSSSHKYIHKYLTSTY